MNAAQDVILGVLGGPWCGFKYPGVEAYLISIQRSGFTGRKVMLAWQIRSEVKQKLIEYGFEVVDIMPWPPEPFFHARMRLAWDYLKDHHKEFRFVFWLDVKDLILQSNPSVWMEQNIGNAKLIASSECVTIEQEETNQIWARDILGEEKYREIKNDEVINGGTWAGESEAMTEVFHQVHLGCNKYTGQYPPCQIWINYVMHTKPFVNMLRIPRWSEGFAACLHPMWWSGARAKCKPYLRDEPPVLNAETSILYPGIKGEAKSKGVAFNDRWGKDVELRFLPADCNPLAGVGCVEIPSNKPFSIVHGYDRDWGLKAMFEFKYRFDGGYSLSSYKKYNSDVVAQLPQIKRLRRPVVQGIVSDSKLPQPPRVFVRST